MERLHPCTFVDTASVDIKILSLVNHGGNESFHAEFHQALKATVSLFSVAV